MAYLIIFVIYCCCFVFYVNIFFGTFYVLMPFVLPFSFCPCGDDELAAYYPAFYPFVG